RNRNFPFPPGSIHAMVLSHAHIDHSGNIPQLVRQGFRGDILCTHATQDLCRIMLKDSAHIQEMDAFYMNKKRAKKNLPEDIEPLYTGEDADRCMEQFKGIGYGEIYPVSEDLKVTFMDAGHILGSAVVILDVTENGKSKRILFTGDLGRKHLPIIRDPVQVDRANFLITESTYGNRSHDPIENMKAELRRVIEETTGRGGRVVVPAFSVGRTQELVYFLHELFKEKALPPIPIYVDSPLSTNATEVFRLHPECFDSETHSEFLVEGHDPFGFHRLRYIREAEESKKLNELSEPCIIISASGMCEAGRILHHLKRAIPNPRNTVLIVGFMAENTLGRRIVEKLPEVKIHGELYPLRASVEVSLGFSAHADREELLAYIEGIDRKGLERIFVVHGEPESADAFASTLRDKKYPEVTVPKRGDRFSL
ncbi:MBL fold metallo-hydrolase, partial [bacterium]|nr:MBL fold metallo-hydrolase [bacterium]